MDDVTSKEVLAQDIMDMYYEEFKEENENFHDIDFFIRQVEDTYAEILKAEWEKGYAALRSEAPNNLVEFGGMWLRMKNIEFKEDKDTGYFKADISDIKVFTFPYDQSNTGFQTVLPVKRDACKFSRTSIRQLYLQKHLPKTDVQFWWVEPKEKCDGFNLFATNNCCKKGKLFYVAEDADEISKGAANMIKDRIFELLHKSQGKVIDTSNDSNPNAVPQTEMNKEELR